MKLISSPLFVYNKYLYLYITKILLFKNLKIIKLNPPPITRQNAFNYYITS